MTVRSIKNLIASGDLRAQLKMAEIMRLQGSLIFYHGALETGLCTALSAPSTLDELAGALRVANRQLLSSLLDLGISIGEISIKNGRYRLKGPTARALGHNTPLAELLRETVLYHADVARRIGTYLTRNEKGDYLKDFGGVIAESSRVTEPLIRAFIHQTVKKNAPLEILEIGCGAGEYLKYYGEINRDNGGIAVEIDAAAAAKARKRTAELGIDENFTVIHDSILETEALRDRTFDLVTSFSNIYYFSGEQRMRLFSSIHTLLRDRGRFILATGTKGRSLSSSYYDILFSATRGLYPLPETGEIVRDLRRCGFSRVKTVRLMGRSFMGFVAWR
ncbi:MAG: class I SAM-dependent methyltransferase [Spirochaetes bacterium]|nr:class I SAM-dependent methyltransferase [Spirochaetota bacterium]